MVKQKQHYEFLRKNIECEIMLTDDEWNKILEKVSFIKLRKNEFLQIQNSNSSFEAFILKGALKTYFLDENGIERVVFFSFENQWVCETESFYHQKPNKYNIKALEDCEVLIITKSNKMQLFEQVPKLIQFHIIMVEKANIAIQERLLDVLNKNSKQRYQEFVEKHPNKIKSITNKNLSSYLGFSHEFLSKIKNRM